MFLLLFIEILNNHKCPENLVCKKILESGIMPMLLCKAVVYLKMWSQWF